MGREENQSISFYHSVISETYLHLLRTSWISGFENFPLVLINRILSTVSIHEHYAWLLKCHIFQPKGQVACSGGMPIQSLDFYASSIFFWTHLKRCCLHHLTKDCEGISKQHTAWVWQNYWKHVVVCAGSCYRPCHSVPQTWWANNFRTASIKLSKCIEKINSMGQNIWAIL